MLTILPVLLLFLTSIVMVVIRFVRPKFSYFWLVATLGSLFAWLSVAFSRIHYPHSLSLSAPTAQSLSFTTLGFTLDAVSWPFALALSTLTLAVILTAVAQMHPLDWRAWSSSLALAGIGLLAVQASNPFTILMAWAALDLLEITILLIEITESEARNNVVIIFAARVTGIILLIGALLLSVAEGKQLAFNVIPPNAAVLMMIAAGLRLGVLPLHLPFLKEFRLRRGLGTTFRLIPAASSLVLLARLADAGIASNLSLWLLLLSGLAGIYGAAGWLASRDELAGRPFWVIGTAALAVAAAVRGQPEASLAWGLACLFSGSFIFLHHIHSKNMLPLSIAALIGFTALPFTLAWNGTALYNPPPLLSLPLLLWITLSLVSLITHSLLLAGYARHALRPTEVPPGLERWVWIVYPAGLGLLVAVTFLVGFLIRPDLHGIPWTAWGGGVAALILTGILWFMRQRQVHLPRRFVGVVQQIFSLTWFYNLFWAVFQALRRLIDWITLILEGDGGILWALLLLVLLLSIFFRQGQGG